MTNPRPTARCRSLLAGLAVTLTAAAAPAQTWVPQPDGSQAYETFYTSSGAFACRDLSRSPGTTCSANGQSVLFTYGGRAVALTYHAVNNPVSLTPDHGTRVTYGEIETSFSGDTPFTFPLSSNSGYPLFDLTIQLQTAGDGANGRLFRVGYANPNAFGPSNGQALSLAGLEGGAGSYAVFRTVTPYPGTNRGYSVIFSEISSVVLPAANGRVSLDATVSLAPEPGSWVLLATGLGGLAVVASRRRRTR